MGKRAGDVNDPRFVTESGIEIRIRKIGALVMRRFGIEWNKSNPEPHAPVQVLDDPAKTEIENKKDPLYVKEYNKWVEASDESTLEFILRFGVKSEPPEGWDNPFPVGEGTSLKQLWLETILLGEDLDWKSNDSIMNVITGLAEVTEAGVEDAKKN